MATNYLPKALALAESLRRHENAVLKILFIDVPEDAGLPAIEGVECLSTTALGLSAEEVSYFAMAYDLVEFATAVKPLLLEALLGRSEEVVYLDPDTYVTAPMDELGPALAGSAGGILLTPHFLHPTTPAAGFSDGHMLLVGVYNLGFCAVDRRALDFLRWWWGHLRTECLLDPLSGLFVDQKWVDIGSALFEASSFRHAGYNVGVGNVSERPLAEDSVGFYVSSTGDRLRLFHFHAFDSQTPETLSTRFAHSQLEPLERGSVVWKLCHEYAASLSAYERRLPPPPPYPYNSDSRGRRITKQLRRAYRVASEDGSRRLPSPFDTEEATDFQRWRRSAWRVIGREMVGDGAKFARVALVEEYGRFKARYPKVAKLLNRGFSDGTGVWG